jgi:hypothetical protein
MGRSLSFQPPLVSDSLDLLLNFTRSHEVGRAEKLVDKVAETVAKTSGWHRWQWEGRLAHARAEMASARGRPDEAICFANSVIAQSQPMGRVKYHTIGLKTRAEALASLGCTQEAIGDLREAAALARGIADPGHRLTRWQGPRSHASPILPRPRPVPCGCRTSGADLLIIAVKVEQRVAHAGCHG